jgi:hypothetical protein
LTGAIDGRKVRNVEDNSRPTVGRSSQINTDVVGPVPGAIGSPGVEIRLSAWIESTSVNGALATVRRLSATVNSN